MRRFMIALAIAVGLTACQVPLRTAEAAIWRCFTTYDWWGNAITNCSWVCDPIVYDAFGTCN